jgi:hypothetical protein
MVAEGCVGLLPVTLIGVVGCGGAPPCCARRCCNSCSKSRTSCVRTAIKLASDAVVVCADAARGTTIEMLIIAATRAVVTFFIYLHCTRFSALVYQGMWTERPSCLPATRRPALAGGTRTQKIAPRGAGQECRYSIHRKERGLLVPFTRGLL